MPVTTSAARHHGLGVLLRSWIAAPMVAIALGACESPSVDRPARDGSSPPPADASVQADGSGHEDPDDGPPRVAQLATAFYHSCALVSTGQVVCWGFNGEGQLGQGSTDSLQDPVAVTTLRNATAIDAAGNTTCILDGDGDVACWGDNEYGQIPGSPSSIRTTPFVLPEIAEVTSLALGSRHGCAVQSRGTVVCWGNNVIGQLGRPISSGKKHPPGAVEGIDDAVDIASGTYFTCVAHESGQVSCWGDNRSGQLADDTFESRGSPMTVPGIDDAIAVRAGGPHACALHRSGTVSCWGDNRYGQLGGAGSGEHETAPVQVLEGVDDLDTGGWFGCALAEGTLSCWGQNTHGQLGDGTQDDRSEPRPVSGLPTPAQIAAGGWHVCTLDEEDEPWCWGNNGSRQVAPTSDEPVVATPTKLLGLLDVIDEY